MWKREGSVSGQLPVEEYEGKCEKGVTFPPHGAYIDSAVLWTPQHPGVMQLLRNLVGLGGMLWMMVFFLVPTVLQDQVISQGEHLRHNKPLREIQLFQPHQAML